MPRAIGAVPALADNLKIQDRAAQRLKQKRHELGALEFETVEAHAQFDGDALSGLTAERRNRAKELIENFMIAANSTTAEFLERHRFPVLRRVVRSPERWERIVAIAHDYGVSLPERPEAKALNEFLLARQSADPLRFPDLSLSIIKLLGRGEYTVTFPGDAPTGHFGLAVSEYTHSTAPNRRYPDLVTQRLLKAALAQGGVPYGKEELQAVATQCTTKEEAANKVERKMKKSTAACLLGDRIGQEFDGVVTGASTKGTWVRTFDPPVEGRVVRGDEGLDVGDRARVKLIHTDVERGFIDFARVGHTEVGRGSR
jgi:exoribonuclease R